MRCRIAEWGVDDICSPDCPCTECINQPQMYFDMIEKNINRNEQKKAIRKSQKCLGTKQSSTKKGKTELEQIYDAIVVDDSDDELGSLQSENLQEDDSHGIAI